MSDTIKLRVISGDHEKEIEVEKPETMDEVVERIDKENLSSMEETIENLRRLMDEGAVGIAFVTVYKDGGIATGWSAGACDHVFSILGGLTLIQQRLITRQIEEN